jgi:hypothetical protein
LGWLRVQAELVLSDDDLGLFRREFWAGDKLDTVLIDYIRVKIVLHSVSPIPAYLYPLLCLSVAR